MNILDNDTSTVAHLDGVFDALHRCALIAGPDGRILAVNAMLKSRIKYHLGHDVAVSEYLEDIFCGTREQLASDMRSATAALRITFELAGGNAEQREKVGFQVSGIRDSPGGENQFLLVEANSGQFSEKFMYLNRKLITANRKATLQRRNFEALENSYQELERFSYFAAHDLQAPLRSISNWLRFLSEDYGDNLPAEAMEYLQTAESSAERLGHLIDALLTLARSDTVEIEKTDICVADILRNPSESLKGQMALAGGRIEPDENLGTVQADEALFRLLIENIIGNALKYRSPDRAPVVRIHRVAAEGGPEIHVVDNGIGFEEQYRKQIFQPFKRLSTLSEVAGSGVGLAICKRICERHGWQLSADGVPDQGATFRIMLSGHPRRG